MKIATNYNCAQNKAFNSEYKSKSNNPSFGTLRIDELAEIKSGELLRYKKDIIEAAKKVSKAVENDGLPTFSLNTIELRDINKGNLSEIRTIISLPKTSKKNDNLSNKLTTLGIDSHHSTHNSKYESECMWEKNYASNEKEARLFQRYKGYLNTKHLESIIKQAYEAAKAKMFVLGKMIKDDKFLVVENIDRKPPFNAFAPVFYGVVKSVDSSALMYNNEILLKSVKFKSSQEVSSGGACQIISELETTNPTSELIKITSTENLEIPKNTLPEAAKDSTINSIKNGLKEVKILIAKQTLKNNFNEILD